jgi:DNA polymerase-3 subunit alpha
LEELKTISLAEVEAQRNGKEVTVAVLIVGVRPMRSRKGARWAIYTLQDMTGVQEMLAFPESFAKLENVLKPGTPLLLKARVQIEEAGTRLSLQEGRRLEDLAERQAPPEFRVRLEMDGLSESTLDQLEDLFTGCPGPSPVLFELHSPDGSVAILQAQQRVTVKAELIESVRQICGAQAVELVM